MPLDPSFSADQFTNKKRETVSPLIGENVTLIVHDVPVTNAVGDRGQLSDTTRKGVVDVVKIEFK